MATEIDDDGELPDGTPLAAAAALLRAVVGGDGIEPTRADAALAYELDRVGSPYRAVARYIEGGTLAIQGRQRRSTRTVAGGRDAGRDGVARRAGAVPRPARRARRRRRRLGRRDAVRTSVSTRSSNASGSASDPPWASRSPSRRSCTRNAGDAAEARAEAKHALFLVSMLATVAPWIYVEARIFLARAFLLLGDVGLARGR